MQARKDKTNTSALLKRLKERKVMTAQELGRYVSGRVALRRLADGGKIVSIGSGIYASPTLDPFAASVIAVSRYYPKTVISGLTAMAIHQLTDERIDRMDVDIERSHTIRNKFLKCHRVPRKRLIGIEKMDFQKERIRIYDKERTLCEAYRIDPGGPLFFKALKRYLKQQYPDTTRIQRYDQVLRTKVISHLQQELADG